MHELVIEAGRTERQYWERPLAVSGVILLFGMMRYSHSLQADGGGRGAECDPSIVDNGRPNRGFRTFGQNAFRRRIISDSGLLRPAAMAVLFHCPY